MLERIIEDSFSSAAKATVVTSKVFTSAIGGGGNPAVVVMSQTDFTEQAMGSIAAKAGLPVTVFANCQGSNASLRFFSKGTELPMCGHGTLAASFALHSHFPHLTTMTTASGDTIEPIQKGDLYYLQMNLPREIPLPSEIDQLYSILSLTESDLEAPIFASTAGSPKVFIPLKSRQKVDSLKPNFRALEAWSRHSAINGVYVYTSDIRQPDTTYYARSFNPLSGAQEDAATGVAAVVLGAHSLNPDISIVQGFSMGSPSYLYVSRKPESILLGGYIRAME